jgi:hypothetical protein
MTTTQQQWGYVIVAGIVSGVLAFLVVWWFGWPAMDITRNALLVAVGAAVIAASFFLSLTIFTLLD